MKKRTLTMLIALVAALALATTGTLAYLTDTDSDVNVMTLGNVSIDQFEMQRAEGVAHNDTAEDGDLIPFVEGQPLYPAYADPSVENPYTAKGGSSGNEATMTNMFKWGDYTDVTLDGNGLWDDGLIGAMDKFVFVKNTGASDCYFRTWIAYECPECLEVDGNTPMDLFINVNAAYDSDFAGYVEIDGQRYLVDCYTYKDARNEGEDKYILPAGSTARPSLLQVVLTHNADNEDIEALGETYEILAFTQAVQTTNFPDAHTALNAAFGEPAIDNHPWQNEDGSDYEVIIPPFAPSDANGDDENVTYEIPEGAYRVTNSDELKDAVAAGETTLLLAAGEYNIDACGLKTLTLVGEDLNGTIIKVVGGEQGEANGQLDYGLDSSTVTFQNLTIKTNNATYAGYARLKATYKNVNFDSCYCLNGDSAFEYCTFDVAGDQYNIWTWGAPTATFDHCTFNSDGKAVLLYGTVNTNLTIENSVFNDTGVLPDLKAAIEIGNDYGTTYSLTVNNVTVNGYEINDKGTSTGSTLWANKNSMPTDKLNVVVDGVDVY